ncbi:cytochrome P450 4C1-like [Choristoneura fumiferana]|uniref:cytochrome P450 4C1-like n=1 Tax=Choristoneura fumiferana TaxID=7141 RepID=UPI003D155EE0
MFIVTNMWITVVIALVAIYIIVAVLVSRSRANKGPRPPEYPGALPLIGHGHLFGSGNSDAFWLLLQDCYRFANSNSGVAGLRIVQTQYYMVTDPDDCVTLANTALDKDVVYDFMKPFLGEGLLTATVPIWKIHRKLLTPAFSQGVLDGFIGVFNSQSKKLVSSLNQEDGKKPFDFWTYIGPNALETICLTAMGGATTDDRLTSKYMRATENLYNIIVSRFQRFWLHNNFVFNLTSLGRRQKKYIKMANGVTSAVLERRKNELVNGTPNSEENSGKKLKAFIDLIIEYSGERGLLSDQEIREEVSTIIIAGHDTSASTIVYTLVLLGSHPEIQERVFKEIDEVLGDRDVEKQDLPKLVFVEAVLKEALRLYPIAPFIVRRLTESLKLKHYTLPAGSSAFLAIHALHRHKMWGDDAEHFLPDRWLDKNRIPEHQAAFAAFSLGRRMCIGKNYALMNMKTTLAHLIRSFRFKSNISELKLKIDLMLKPHAGHYIAVERRM